MSNITQKDLTNNSIGSAPVVVAPVAWRPTMPTIEIFKPGPLLNPTPSTPTSTARKVNLPQSSGADPSGKGGVPERLLSLAAVQSPLKQQTYTNCNVTISFTRDTSDANYDHVNIWLTGYRKNTNPVLVASGSSSPFNFTADASGESVTVTAQTVSAAGLSADLQFALSTTVTLSGQISAPPAPTISQQLTGTPIGYQFIFNQVSLPGNDQEVIESYRVYRNTSNTPGSAVIIQTIPADPTLTGAVVVTDQINLANATPYYYWVSAVNTAGLESTLTSAQSSAVVTSTGAIPPSLNTAFSYTSTTSSITWTWTGLVIYRADGSTTSVTNGSQAITGLSANTTYQFYPYYDEPTGTLQWVSGSGVGSPAIAWTARGNAQTQAQSLSTRSPLSTAPMPAATTSSGSGGGSGGGSGTCLRSDMLIESVDGVMEIESAVVGDWIACPEGWTQIVKKTVRPQSVFIKIVTAYSDTLIVTPTHTLTRGDGSEVEAQKLTLLDMIKTRNGADSVERLELVRGPFQKVLLTCEPTHTFFAGASAPLIVAHNFQPIC